MEVSLTSLLWIFLPTLVTILLASTMGLFGGNKMPVEGKTVLITGASEGMGLSVARKLAAKGANIVIISRSAAKLEEALKTIKAAAKNPTAQRFLSIAADVAAPSYAGPLLAQVTEWNNGRAPDIVWCIAGVSKPELFLDMEIPSMRRQMDVNFYGTADMSHAILKEWLAPDAPVETQPKHLIMTCSVIALYTVLGYAPYAPAKWALRGLADTLSQEVLLYPQNVKVHVVYPGSILSPGFEVENRTKPAVTKLIEESDPQQTPDEVAENAIQGLERGNYYVTVSWLGALMRWGALGGAFRNNWIIDTLGSWFVAIVWMFVLPDIKGKVRKYGKQHGHPSTYKTDQK